MKRVIEGGHFYSSEWFAQESEKWWEITQSLCQNNGNESMLFIDDVHDESMHDSTVILPIHIDCSQLRWEISEQAQIVIDQANKNDNANTDSQVIILQPHHIYLESDMYAYTLDVIDILDSLPRRKRTRYSDWKWAFCSNVKILHADGTPTCVGYDLWLTHLKRQRWFKEALNILPASYYEQQVAVKRIYRKIDPDFSITQHYT